MNGWRNQSIKAKSVGADTKKNGHIDSRQREKMVESVENEGKEQNNRK